eukprot:Awhi_evm1s1769
MINKHKTKHAIQTDFIAPAFTPESGSKSRAGNSKLKPVAIQFHPNKVKAQAENGLPHLCSKMPASTCINPPTKNPQNANK